MIKSKIFKRLYENYTSKFIGKIFLAAFFSVIVAASTSAIAWLLDPAIEKIFINKDQTLIILIPFAIIIAPLGGTNIARMSSRPELWGGGMGTDRSRPMWTRWIQIWSLFTTNVKAVRDTCVAAVHGASLCAI